MSIVRTKRSEAYFSYARSAPQDQRLSWAARGLHAYLMSKPDDWSVQVKDLIKQGNLGRDGIYALLRELEEHGYIKRTQERKDNGRVGALTTVVFESPSLAEEHTEQPLTAQPHAEQPITAEPHTYIIESSTEKRIVQKTDSSPHGEEDLSLSEKDEARKKEKQPLYAAYYEILALLEPGSTANNRREVDGAISRLHKEGCTPDELTKSYTYYKMEKGWHDRHLSLQTVAKNLGAWRAGGSPESAYKPKRKRVYKEYTPEQEALDRADSKRVLGEDYEPGIFPKNWNLPEITGEVKDEYL